MTAQRLKIAFAVYTIVLALLIGYAIHLRGRLRTLLRALERERD